MNAILLAAGFGSRLLPLTETTPKCMGDEYKAETGRDILQDFPLWEPAHKTLLCNGIPGVENAGGDLDALTGKRMTFMAFPLRWEDGDGSVVRLIGIEDPSGSARL